MNTKNFVITMLAMAVLMTVSTTTFSQNVKKNEKTMKMTTSSVCEMCKKRLEEGLAYEKGIKDVSLDLNSKELTVVYNPKKTDESAITLLVNNLGYDANESKANPEAYEKLPACCKNHDGHKCTHH
ncbi:MAG TPA: heavy metal-associated domain-containing protein [Bacteroidales bacterium]|nr:heavy metal-associated domain-containing protein [Bacteroidales bacterium]HPS26838.1 heavy metal-associated domain-containing protein [Bacteroidales bacterium]